MAFLEILVQLPSGQQQHSQRQCSSFAAGRPSFWVSSVMSFRNAECDVCLSWSATSVRFLPSHDIQMAKHGDSLLESELSFPFGQGPDPNEALRDAYKTFLVFESPADQSVGAERKKDCYGGT